MHVTYLLKNKEFKKKLKEIITYPKGKIEEDLEFIGDPKNYSLIGHAYEILFQIEYLKKRKSVNINTIKSFRKRGLLLKFKASTSDEYMEKIEVILDKLKNIEKNIYLYIQGKRKLSLKNVLYLAKVGNIRELSDIEFSKIKKRDISDMEELHLSFKKKEVIKLLEKEIEFNIMVQHETTNGEIDMKLKDCIIDIKTVISGRITKDTLNQLVLYYCLAKNELYKPKKIGIFFSRFGKVKYFKIRDLISEEKEKEILKLL